MIVWTTMVMTLIGCDSNLISMKLFFEIDQSWVSPLGVGTYVQLDEPLCVLCIISMRLICGDGLRGLVFFMKYFMFFTKIICEKFCRIKNYLYL